MDLLKTYCKIDNAQLGDDLQIGFDILIEGKLMELWSASPSGGKIMAQVNYFGDDGQQGDDLIHVFEYPLKLSNPGSDFLEEKAIIPFQNRRGDSADRFVLNEDQNGRDEVYAIFYLTMTFETVEGLVVDAVISDLVRTNTLKKAF